MKNGSNKKLVQRVEFIKAACRGKTVLHLGCTNWPYTREAIDNGMLLHSELRSISSELYGFDFDQAGIDELAASGVTNLFQADLERLDQVPIDRKFDVIVAGEMIEHLNNPGLFLKGIQRFMSSETRLLITTINAYCGMRFLLYGLRGERGMAEPVHPDHVAYYSYSTLTLLIQRHGLQVDDLLFYDIGTEHRPHNRWFINAANDICVRIAPQWADGIIAECRLASDPKESQRFVPMPSDGSKGESR